MAVASPLSQQPLLPPSLPQLSQQQSLPPVTTTVLWCALEPRMALASPLPSPSTTTVLWCALSPRVATADGAMRSSSLVIVNRLFVVWFCMTSPQQVRRTGRHGRVGDGRGRKQFPCQLRGTGGI